MLNFVVDKMGKEIELKVSKGDLELFENKEANILVSLIYDEKQLTLPVRLKP